MNISLKCKVTVKRYSWGLSLNMMGSYRSWIAAYHEVVGVREWGSFFTVQWRKTWNWYEMSKALNMRLLNLKNFILDQLVLTTEFECIAKRWSLKFTWKYQVVMKGFHCSVECTVWGKEGLKFTVSKVTMIESIVIFGM